MRILIDTLQSPSRLTLNEIFYLDKCFQLLMNEHTQHQWLIDVGETTKGIISLLPVGIKKTIAWKKLRPDILIEASGDLSIQKSFRQITFFNQRFEANAPKMKLDGAHVGVTTSTWMKNRIVNRFGVNESYIQIIPAAPDTDISVADWSEKLHVKEKYSDGRDFFLCFKTNSKNSQWEEVLKAFSGFKKWQQSSFKLLLVSRKDSSYEEEFREKFESYKYREDVLIVDPGKEDITRILPCAFGVICAEVDQSGIWMLNAFKAEVPVISSSAELFDEEVSGAFLPAVPSVEELSRQLINLYRDERLRDILIQKGKEQLSRFSWEASAAKWYKCISELAR